VAIVSLCWQLGKILKQGAQDANRADRIHADGRLI
jgi:hypothetical protein